MTSRLFFSLATAAVIAMPLCFGGCETHHEETTRQNLLGGQTHQETTTVRNPVTGEMSTESSKQVTH